MMSRNDVTHFLSHTVEEKKELEKRFLTKALYRKIITFISFTFILYL